jgi:PAS domain-containing protein
MAPGNSRGGERVALPDATLIIKTFERSMRRLFGYEPEAEPGVICEDWLPPPKNEGRRRRR